MNKKTIIYCALFAFFLLVIQPFGCTAVLHYQGEFRDWLETEASDEKFMEQVLTCCRNSRYAYCQLPEIQEILNDGPTCEVLNANTDTKG